MRPSLTSRALQLSLSSALVLLLLLLLGERGSWVCFVAVAASSRVRVTSRPRILQFRKDRWERRNPDGNPGKSEIVECGEKRGATTRQLLIRTPPIIDPSRNPQLSPQAHLVRTALRVSPPSHPGGRPIKGPPIYPHARRRSWGGEKPQEKEPGAICANVSRVESHSGRYEANPGL